MKIINPINDFGSEFFDVGDEDLVNLYVDKIDIEENSEIELSFVGCITNYPTTSRIIDTVLNQISKLAGKKTLIIKVNLDDDPIHLLNALFFGSTFLGIHESSELLPIDQMKDTIKKKVECQNIDMSICLVSKTGMILKYYYEKY